MIRICVAGATGWVGRSLVPAILAAPDLELSGAVARGAAGKTLREALALPGADLEISRTVDEALAAPADVLVDYTGPGAVKEHALAAIARGVHVVVGTSGLTRVDDDEIDRAARAHGVGVIAAGNFAISAVLLQHFATVAARHLKSWEVIDYASASKVDAPSGTARELAQRLAAIGAPATEVPIDRTHGSREARGLTLEGTQVHSVRLPGYVIGVEALFGRTDERLTIRYEGGSGAEPYVAGTLLAVRRVGEAVGLRRGLDRLLDLT